MTIDFKFSNMFKTHLSPKNVVAYISQKIKMMIDDYKKIGNLKNTLSRFFKRCELSFLPLSIYLNIHLFPYTPECFFHTKITAIHHCFRFNIQKLWIGCIGF